MQAALDAGLEIDRFAPRLAFFFNGHNNVFQEVAKFRAARRMWAKIMRERFGAQDERSWRLRFHTQTGGVTLTAQQPENNIVRVALQGFAAVCGGTQSLHTNGFDEALALPTERAAKIALRTQQIIGYESGAADTVDPFAGSYFVESLTDEIETRAQELIDKVAELGGSVQAIDFIKNEIEESAFGYYERYRIEQDIVVGVNKFVEDTPEVPDLLRVDPESEHQQVARLKAFKADRDQELVARRLDEVRDARPRDRQPAAAAARSAQGPLLDRRGLRRDARRVRRLPADVLSAPQPLPSRSMMAPAVYFVQVILALHILSVVAAFGVLFAYPIFLTIGANLDPGAMPWFHRMQQAVSRWLIGPGLLLVVIFGVILASKYHAWHAFYVQWGIGAAIVMGALEGMFMIPREGRLADLARRDLEAAQPGRSPARSRDPQRRVPGRVPAGRDRRDGAEPDRDPDRLLHGRAGRRLGGRRRRASLGPADAAGLHARAVRAGAHRQREHEHERHCQRDQRHPGGDGQCAGRQMQIAEPGEEHGAEHRDPERVGELLDRVEHAGRRPDLVHLDAGEDEVEQLPEAETGAEADQHQARGELEGVQLNGAAGRQRQRHDPDADQRDADVQQMPAQPPTSANEATIAATMPTVIGTSVSAGVDRGEALAELREQRDRQDQSAERGEQRQRRPRSRPRRSGCAAARARSAATAAGVARGRRTQPAARARPPASRRSRRAIRRPGPGSADR